MLLGNTHHVIGRSIALLGNYILVKIYVASVRVFLDGSPCLLGLCFFSGLAQWCAVHNWFISGSTLVYCLSIF